MLYGKFDSSICVEWLHDIGLKYFKKI